jgi:hypothetical protein
MLHITNGDSAGDSLRAAGLPGEVMAWRDVLYEGPVPADLAPEALREVRARFIADRGWGEYDAALAAFAARDTALADAVAQDEMVLWFEHDLCDQSQLIQIFDRLADAQFEAVRLSLICIGDYPVAPRFMGLGQLTPAQLAGLFPTRQRVTAGQLALGRGAWAAFRASDPTAIEPLLAGDTSALPFLAGALTRHLEQFPTVGDGLARTERAILEAVAAGANTPPQLFAAIQDREERAFLGDLSVWGYVRELSSDPQPLLVVAGGGDFMLPDASGNGAAFAAQELVLTAAGRAALAGTADWVALHGIDRWYGGVHLRGHTAAWRWDSARRRIVAAQA